MRSCMWTTFRVIFWTGLLIAGSWVWIVWGITRFAERDDTRHADAAIVLGAAVRNNRPTSIFRERINHAVDLYHDGTVEKLIFTGGVGRGDTMSEAAVARRYAISQGVDENDILIEEKSTNTIENLTFAYAVAQEEEVETFLIVSTPYHMKRAIWIADDLGMTAYSSPTRTIRWISDRTRRAALIQESISYIVHIFRRWS
ncbi:MAG: YdcF family protein [Ardenticatenaceae bacterium]|nr:YdcF family protein [Ardenticatenaceae bacterium]